MVGEVKRSQGFVFVIALGLAASCGGTVETRSAPSGVETGTGGSAGDDTLMPAAGYPPVGGSSSNGGFQIGGSPVTAGSGAGSCNPAFCQPEATAIGCCMTLNGPCGVDYGNGCIPRGTTPARPQWSCTDGVQNGTETDVDCGGQSCAPCATGSRCIVNPDCATYWCVAGVCGVPSLDAGTAPGCDGSACTPTIDASPVPSCIDGVTNGSETDVDCGGECAPCITAKKCNVPDDCMSRTCFANHTCGTAECNDAIYNGTETDVDCGGGLCARCPTGKHCNMSPDCASLVCVNSMCMAPSCADGVRNGDEVCVDCGGSCPPCTNCPAD